MTEKKKIELVDDSDLVAGMMARFLEGAGYSVVRARDGVEGIEVAYREVPDCIIMDVEMPMLQGYQASRLLKNSRGVKDIPILMHTSMSDDRDKYWAMTSGADAFVAKDFDNFDTVLKEVKKLCKHRPFDVDVIREDAGRMNRDTIFEMMGSLYDRQLFKSTILNMLGDVGRDIGSIKDTARKIIYLASMVCGRDITVLLINNNRQTMAFISPDLTLFRDDVDDFYNICLNDYLENFPENNPENTILHMEGIENRKDFDSRRTDNKKINSYVYFILKGKGGAAIATLHLGNLANNYFSDIIMENLRVFAEGAGVILENSILFNQVTEMKDRIRNVFSKYVPAEIIDDLVERKDGVALLSGEKREVVVLFSDIRSFTTISEKNSAESVVFFLNNYFNIMVDVIEKYGGTIDKFIGDAILAIFGAPVSYEDNAVRACMAAAQMIGMLGKVDVSGLALPEQGLDIGIGIHEGIAIVGNIGAVDKVDYTVIGDAVNLAARLEGLTKHYKQRILVSDSFKNKVDPIVFLREVDTVKVKGKAKATTIYALEMSSENFDEDFMKNYNNGLMLYKMGNWNTAVDYFKMAQKRIPDDYSTAMFIERCIRFSQKPPEDWDGAIALDFK